MDVVRTAVSVLAHFDPETEDGSHDASVRKAETAAGSVPVAVAAHYRLSRGMETVPRGPTWAMRPTSCGCCAAGSARPDDVRALDVSLILYAEHEFNASTFTARVVCSTLADLHSAIAAAIGALERPLHGGANEKVMEVLEAVGGPDRAEAWLRHPWPARSGSWGSATASTRRETFARHPKPFARKAAEAAGAHWEETAEIIERILTDEKHLYPNLDWPSARLYYALGLEMPLYTPIFVMARVTGWSAHFIEQHEHNRLIRPRCALHRS